MYGFGDDRNPSNDTVNVMEEILIEYIIDVVCSLLYHVGIKVTEKLLLFLVPAGWRAKQETSAFDR